jgi:hypothetical protein
MEMQQNENGVYEIIWNAFLSTLILILTFVFGLPVLLLIWSLIYGGYFIANNFFEKWSIFIYNHPSLHNLESDFILPTCIFTSPIPFFFFFVFYFTIFIFTAIIFTLPIHCYFVFKGSYYNGLNMKAMDEIYKEIKVHVVTLLQLIL